MTVEYNGTKPVRVEAVIVAAQHNATVEMADLRRYIRESVIAQFIPAELMDKKSWNNIFINGTGRFEQGGPFADTGITDRKIIVDTYGGVGSHGGGCFSGKDPSKVDRFGSYMARYVAKNLVAAGIADRLEIQIAYCIGVAEPVSIMVDTFGTAKISEDTIKALVRAHFPLTPKGMVRHLDLLRPIFQQTAAYGHFGRDEDDFTWEKTDKARELRKDAKLS